MKFHFTSYPIFLLCTFIASHMCWISDAINIDGMVRLYRGEGDYNDGGPDAKHLTQSNGSGMSFVTASPYGHVSGSSSRQVAQFSGAGARYTTDTTGLPAGASPRTMMGWLNWNGSAQPGYQASWSYGNNAIDEAFNQCVANGEILMDLYMSHEGVNPMVPRADSLANTWYHAVVSWDDTTSTLKAYINGSLVKSSSTEGDVPNTNPARIMMGAEPHQSLTGGYFQGQVADFAVFNRALLDQEIAAIYNAKEGLTSGANTAVGDSCLAASSSSPCPSGSTCDSVSSTCKVANGGTCSVDSDCVSGMCGVSTQCVEGTIGSSCTVGGDCSSTFCVSNQCTDGAVGTACDSVNDCNTSLICLSTAKVCSDGANTSPCDSGSDCSSGFCSSVDNTCTTGDNGTTCASGIDCSSGYCSPTSNICATRPILDPCHGITCSNHGKCKGNGVCHCEDTFIQTNNGKDCACPDGSFLNASVNRCYAPTSSPTVSPTSSPVTASPTSSPTSVVTSAPTPEAPCEDGSGTFTVNDNKEVGCDWLSKNKKREQKRKDTYCALNEVKLMCPNTCDGCACDDSSSYTFELKNGMNEVGCDWISKNSNKAEKRRAKYCTADYDDGALINACAKSCNLC